jgi:hypothetical protein
MIRDSCQKNLDHDKIGSSIWTCRHWQVAPEGCAPIQCTHLVHELLLKLGKVPLHLVHEVPLTLSAELQADDELLSAFFHPVCCPMSSLLNITRLLAVVRTLQHYLFSISPPMDDAYNVQHSG